MNTEAKKLEFRVQHLDCENEAAKIEGGLKNRPGVLALRIFPKAGKVALEIDPGQTSPEAVAKALGDLGFPVVRGEDEAPPKLGSPKVLASLTSGVLLLVGWLLTWTSTESWISSAVLGTAMVVGGYFFVREALEKLVQRRRIGIELLMATAAVGAAALGEVLEGAMLVFLYSISEAAEGFTEQKTRAAVRALMKLAPKVALVHRGGRDVEIPVEELAVGDIFVVRPGESVATDGEVVNGTTHINQAPVTGESVPVPKRPGESVFAATINTEGVIEVRATRTVADNTLAKIIHLVEEAQEAKGRNQRFIERFGDIYSPIVLLAGVLVSVVFAAALGMTWVGAFQRAIVFIVAAAPCALVISIPITLVAALGTGARNGVLLKGGVVLEQLAGIRLIALDKTGTLTRGQPTVTDIVLQPGAPVADAAALLAHAAPIERRSEHPVARALVEHAEHLKVAELVAADVRALPGAGIVATVAGTEVYIGKPGLFSQQLGISEVPHEDVARLEQEGKTVVVIGTARAVWGVIAVRDSVRPEAIEAVRMLQRQKVDLVILSGDHEAAVQRVAKEVGISRFHGGLKPEDKLREIRSMAQQTPVAMVGDGINDAPALAEATVGVAMGAAGTDVALETADVALMGDDLRKLAFALTLARRTRQVVRQNLALSVIVIASLAIGALLGTFSLPVAVLVHELSEFVVIASGLRLLKSPATTDRA